MVDKMLIGLCQTINSGVHDLIVIADIVSLVLNKNLEERIKKDRKNPGLIVEMSRRRLLSNLANLAAYGVIHKSDLEEFSDKMKKDIEEIMDYNGIDYK